MTDYAIRARNRRRRRTRLKIRRAIFLLASALLLVGICYGAVKICSFVMMDRRLEKAAEVKMPEWVDIQLLENDKARTGVKLSAVKNIVIHYVGNPGTSAQNNRDYFNKEDTEVCSHFLVGLDGEIIQCVPLAEKSAATNWRNSDTISIEVCHPDETGKFSDASYDSTIKLTAWLCNQFGLDDNDVIRHYDVTGKMCPLYYVEHENKWEDFKKDVEKKLEEYKKP